MPPEVLNPVFFTIDETIRTAKGRLLRSFAVRRFRYFSQDFLDLFDPGNSALVEIDPDGTGKFLPDQFIDQIGYFLCFSNYIHR